MPSSRKQLYRWLFEIYGRQANQTEDLADEPQRELWERAGLIEPVKGTTDGDEDSQAP